MSFREVTIAELEDGGAIFAIQDGNHGEKHPKVNDYVEDGIPFIMASDLRVGYVDIQGANKLPQSITDRLRIGFCHGGDVLLSHKGSVGYVAIAPDYDPYLMLTPQVTYYRVNEEKLSCDFLRYAFTDPMFQKRLASAAGQQGTRGYVGIRAQRNLTIRFGERTLQDHLVSVVKPFDDLIENNRRRIALLEEAARLLYREWFVHFRFPGHEHVTIVEGLPDGWERVRMAQVLKAVESGGRPRGGALERDGIPSIGAENVIGLGQYDYSKEKYVPEDYFARMRRGVIQSRDVMLYKDGAHIGRTSMFGDGFPHLQGAVNEHVFILRADAGVGQCYLYFWLSQPETRQSVVNLNANTAQPGISQDRLKTLWFLLPPVALRHLFNERVEAHVAQIFRLALMNQKLAEARDLLLPRLMNGEIAV